MHILCVVKILFVYYINISDSNLTWYMNLIQQYNERSTLTSDGIYEVMLKFSFIHCRNRTRAMSYVILLWHRALNDKDRECGARQQLHIAILHWNCALNDKVQAFGATTTMTKRLENANIERAEVEDIFCRSPRLFNRFRKRNSTVKKLPHL